MKIHELCVMWGANRVAHKNHRESWKNARQQAGIYWEDDEPVDNAIGLSKSSTATMEIENK